MDHLRQPIERGVRVAAPHRFDEGGDGVVVRVAVAIVDDGFTLDTLFGDGQIDVDEAIGGWWGGERGDLQRIQGFARVPVRDPGQVAQRFLISTNAQLAQTPRGIYERSV